jgi:hypothetical protein
MVAEASAAPRPSPTPQSRAALSPWLQLMLAEIARKRVATEHERAEAARRTLERAASELPAAVLHISSPQRGS